MLLSPHFRTPVPAPVFVVNSVNEQENPFGEQIKVAVFGKKRKKGGVGWLFLFSEHQHNYCAE